MGELILKCILQEPKYDYDAIADLKIKDPEKYVWSCRDGDGIWGTSFRDLDELVKLFGKEVVEKWLKSGYEEVEVPDSYWENDKGYQVKRKTMFKGKPATVDVPLTLDSVTTVPCPYCQYPRDVEPDANGKIECEGCGKPYILISPI